MEDWQVLLLKYVHEHPADIQRILSALGITSRRTLSRWCTGTSRPQNTYTIRQLAKVLPGYEEQMTSSLKKVFPDAFEADDSCLARETMVAVPSEFFRRVLEAHSAVALSLRRWTISALVLHQIAFHLDPDQSGLAIIFAQCWPVNGQVQSLRVEEGAGTGPWLIRQIQEPFFLGKESLLAMAVLQSRPCFLTPDLVPPILHQEQIRSGLAMPVHRGEQVAGVLCICSTESDFFTPVRQALLKDYLSLFNLAFRDRDFHPLKEVQLEYQPRATLQQFLSVRYRNYLAQGYSPQDAEDLITDQLTATLEVQQYHVR